MPRYRRLDEGNARGSTFWKPEFPFCEINANCPFALTVTLPGMLSLKVPRTALFEVDTVCAHRAKATVFVHMRKSDT